MLFRSDAWTVGFSFDLTAINGWCCIGCRSRQQEGQQEQKYAVFFRSFQFHVEWPQIGWCFVVLTPDGAADLARIKFMLHKGRRRLSHNGDIRQFTQAMIKLKGAAVI